MSYQDLPTPSQVRDRQVGSSRGLTAEALNELLAYDPETGHFLWRKARGRSRENGIAGSMMGPYWCINIKGRHYLAHRVAWLAHYGVYPAGEIDHINQIKTDNRIANLRIVSRSFNAHNMSQAHKGSSSGLRGAYFHKKHKYWSSHFMVNGVIKNLGVFPSKEAAHAAYIKAKTELGLPLGGANAGRPQ